jgi:hypothetical protein
MDSRKTIEVLNGLLAILCRSLPAYLAEARPWAQSADPRLRQAIEHLVADQNRYAQRITEMITKYGGRADPGRFPSEFAAKNDLSLDFLRHELLLRQEQNIAAIARCVVELEESAPLHALAEEILGNAKGHLDILTEKIRDV